MTKLSTPSVYLDYNATSPPRPSALKGAEKALKCWGNPSSVHQAAAPAKALLWEARQALSGFLNCHPLEIIFTSGATEANNHALKGIFQNPKKGRSELLISSVEHPSIMAPAEFLSQKGFTLRKIPVSREGELDENFLDEHLSEKTLLVSIMSANNETGVLFPIERWIEKAHTVGSFFHSDMTQSLGKTPLNLQSLGVDLASFSAHKCYGLKGCGLIYRKKGTPLESLLQGGSQERSQRAGTENLPGIAAFGAVAKEGTDILKKVTGLEILRDRLEEEILSSISGVQIVGKGLKRLPNTSCLCISGLDGETLLMNLDLKGISVSVGSACGSGRLESSSVLRAMGWTEEEARGSLRLSLGLCITEEKINYFIENLKNSVQRLRSF